MLLARVLRLRFPRDPRWYQISSLLALLLYGVASLGLDVRPSRAAVLLTSVLLTQYACSVLARLGAFDPKSALISGLSLCLLLRADSAAFAFLAGVVTIASKFLIRWNGKHVFNPTNFGIVTMILLSGRVWVSPAQWGSAAYLAFLIACLGGLVVNRAARTDVTLAFLLFYASIVLGRAVWLGDPSSIPLRQLQSGSLLIFSFFMISDPKTTPNTRTGRILFALLVAMGAGYVSFVLYRTNGLLWSLAVFSLTVPLIDRLLPGSRYSWGRPNAASPRLAQGVRHEAPVPSDDPPGIAGLAVPSR